MYVSILTLYLLTLTMLPSKQCKKTTFKKEKSSLLHNILQHLINSQLVNIANQHYYKLEQRINLQRKTPVHVNVTN